MGVYMRKVISAILSFSILVMAGCSIPDPVNLIGKNFDNTKGYRSTFDSAEDYAGYKFGPCKEKDSRLIKGESSDVELHTMEDTEYGFEYQVEALLMNYSTSLTPYATYNSEDFYYYYEEEFLKRADLSSITEDYKLTFELEELKPAYTEGMYMPYTNTLTVRTDMELTDEAVEEILKTVMDELERFDRDRQVFTKDPTSKSVWINIFSAPTEKDRSLGRKYGGGSRVYGYNP